MNSNSVLHHRADSMDWQRAFSRLGYAGGCPQVHGAIKSVPEDFQVTELMGFEPEGQGEHVWLWVRKRQQNTEQVAKALAQHAGVAYRDVSYSGMKDFHAVTWQWFSVWLPGDKNTDWQSFTLAGTEIERVQRHTRKLKRGTHQQNRFEIIVRDLAGPTSVLEQSLARVGCDGVPNYFGAQRFGRQFNNMPLAVSHLCDGVAIKKRHLKSIVISAARSWLFNHVLSERVSAASWNRLLPNEPANLHGSNSVFTSTGSDDEQRRLAELDIHPTGPLVGRHSGPDSAFEAQEMAWLEGYQDLVHGLQRVDVASLRRPLRTRVENLQWQIQGTQLALTFTLHAGQFATSVLRECIAETDQS
ncbi:tRNA pseudouridine synthase D [Arenicella chitinivorans]|uniref:tRNA pseudouridine synthase D n=1 Tax=Arenicella chitinivorans TaxID=1329800 RepID=A0A918VLS6_9GAMM|nr:tRNA pseudouridine(13) synthase TruD [Arenicella chitinivorans]GHA08759.1 tRNA pseudouridine synthase D [Arenicella chitinivorans]